MIRLPVLAAAALLAVPFAHADPSVPSPDNVVATVTDDGVLVTWEAVDVALSYDLYRADTGIRIDQVTGTEALDTLEMAPAYFVTACDAIGVCSDPSARASVDGADEGGVDPGGVGPDVPMAVEYTLLADGGASITFEPLDGATGYLLHIDGQFAAYTNTGTEFVVEAFDEMSRYQVSAFFEGGDPAYPPKSRPAVPSDDGGETELEIALATIAQLEIDVQTLTLNLADALADLEVALERIVELEAMIADGMDDDVAELLADLATAEALLAEQAELLAELVEDNLALEARAAADATAITELEVVIDTQEAEIAALEARIAELEGGTDGGTDTGGDDGGTDGTDGGTDGTDGMVDIPAGDDMPPPPPGN